MTNNNINIVQFFKKPSKNESVSQFSYQKLDEYRRLNIKKFWKLLWKKKTNKPCPDFSKFTVVGGGQHNIFLGLMIIAIRNKFSSSISKKFIENIFVSNH